ncbi:hypothetical protein HanPI659440_Chr04g0166741 [Helianthus annuus]|nr:hypothetical protein HanPI659440_Chr04g0166741 [Helianthus annuus]
MDWLGFDHISWKVHIGWGTRRWILVGVPITHHTLQRSPNQCSHSIFTRHGHNAFWSPRVVTHGDGGLPRVVGQPPRSAPPPPPILCFHFRVNMHVGYTCRLYKALLFNEYCTPSLIII